MVSHYVAATAGEPPTPAGPSAFWRSSCGPLSALAVTQMGLRSLLSRLGRIALALRPNYALHGLEALLAAMAS